MEADVLNACRARMANLPGGYDNTGRLLLAVHVPHEIHPWTKSNLELSIKYLLSTLSQETVKAGLLTIIDAQSCSWRVAKSQILNISQLLDNYRHDIIVLRTDVFWDKQRVENCTKSNKKCEPIITSKARLNKYFDINQLPTDLGGTIVYDHDLWIENRVRIDEFKKAYNKVLDDIENLNIILMDSKSMRATEIEQTIKSCNSSNNEVQLTINNILRNGNKIINFITEQQNKKQFVSHDVLDAKESIKLMLNNVEQSQTQIYVAWSELEKSMKDAKEFAALEEGVSYVTNWILSTAESLLNGQLKVGFDVQTSEKLRLDHEILELQCWKTYGYYGELRYKIENFPIKKESFAYKDLLSQRDFMDFVCNSFAMRLQRRRMVLITAVRFFRLVAQYFHQTSEVFESLIMDCKIKDLNLASSQLAKLNKSQLALELIEKDLIREGEKLGDILTMPIKDSLGRDIEIDYSDVITNIRDILDATKARRVIFIDSMELQKLTLEQVSHIYTYENDAVIASKWMDDLYKVMIKSHSHVGCSVHEIQTQKNEHLVFQETAKSTYNYAFQLLSASIFLRQSCKLNCETNMKTIEQLQTVWKKLQIISQEQMTRLRVSAVFHRSVEEHCSKLEHLKSSVMLLVDIEDSDRRKSKLRKYLGTREKLLVEVGRMVRLGRLLKSRLKEPFVLDSQQENMSSKENIVTQADNAIACNAISQKLKEVQIVAESLDSVLRNTEEGFEIFEHVLETSSSASERKHSSNNNSDDWSSSIKSSTEDESFVTASECRASPWWAESTERSSIDLDSSDPEQPNIQLLIGVPSSANVSFDDSESFLSPISFYSDDARKASSTNSSPLSHPKLSSPSEDSSHSENKMYTIFESPRSSQSQNDDECCNEDNLDKVCEIEDINNNLSGLSYYYQNIITKQVIKTCL